MAEQEFQLFKGQEELMAYVNAQQAAGADEKPYFRRVREGLEGYGEIGEGLKPESEANLVRALGLISQAAANGLLEDITTIFPSLNGVNPQTYPDIGIKTWLDYWLIKGMTYEKLGDELRERLPQVALKQASGNILTNQATALAQRGDHLLGQATGERNILRPARESKRVQNINLSRRS